MFWMADQRLYKESAAALVVTVAMRNNRLKTITYTAVRLSWITIKCNVKQYIFGIRVVCSIMLQNRENSLCNLSKTIGGGRFRSMR